MTLKKIILASSSPRRKELLRQLGLEFDVEPSYHNEEIAQELEPLELAKALSYEKARVVSDKHSNALVIAADTFVVLDNEIIGKPHTLTDAKDILTALNGRSHSVITGFTIMDRGRGKILSQSVETKVYIKKLKSQEIDDYVSTREPLGKAGAYAIQDKGAAIVEKIDGDYYNVIGLPLNAVIAGLKEFGIIPVDVATFTHDKKKKFETETSIIEKDLSLRVSIGSAALLGLKNIKVEVMPTTVYTMLGEFCTGRCKYCTQACDNGVDKKYLSRVTWPKFSLNTSLERITTTDEAGRICIQTLKYSKLPSDLIGMVTAIKKVSALPLSVCINPLPKELLVQLKNVGVERVGIGLDCASHGVFKKIKPGFSWDCYTQFIEDVVDVFGFGTVHLIVGLGETDKEMVKQIQRLTDMNCSVGLFAFTPIKGTNLSLKPPEIGRYRALQLVHYLIVHDLAVDKNMIFKNSRIQSIDIPASILENALKSSRMFQTSGCPDCNRPMYNESPRGVKYNYSTILTSEEIRKANKELNNYLQV